MARAELMEHMLLTAARPRNRKKAEAFSYKLVFTVCFVVFLMAMTIESIVPHRWRRMAGYRGAGSIWSDATEAAGSCAAIALQG